MNKLISLTKLKKFATLTFQNSIRLHSDSILLFHAERFQTAFYISVIAMEEMAKAKELEHFYFHSWGDGRADIKFEQEFFLRLYNHKIKQKAFAAREMLEYSPKFLKQIDNKQLDNKKLKALYVGLERHKDSVNIDSRISTPLMIKKTDSRRQISLINSELKEFIRLKDAQDTCFDIEEMDILLDDRKTRDLVKTWKHRMGLKSRKWWTTYWRKELNNRRTP
jgi:AbiV family abortive infection protein